MRIRLGTSKAFSSWAATVALMVFTIAARAEEKVPLWQLEPFDRIVLINDKVYDIDPVRLPEDVLFVAPTKFVVTNRPEKELVVRPDEYIGMPGLPSEAKLRGDARPGLYRIRLQTDGNEYYVSGRSIRTILRYEDILLEEAEKAISQRRFEDAFHLLKTIEDRDPQWPNLRQNLYEFHRQEALQQMSEGRDLAAFESLVAAKKHLERLTAQSDQPAFLRDDPLEPVHRDLDFLARRWCDRELRTGRFAKARAVIARLEQVHPKSSEAVQMRNNVSERSNRALAEARQFQLRDDWIAAHEALELAIRIQPDSPDARRAAEEFFRQHPRLRVAVDQLATFRSGPAHWTAADWRCSRLVHLPLVRLKSLDSGDQAVESPVIVGFEQSNVNMRATVRIRRDVVWPGDQKTVTSLDVLRLLTNTCRKESPLYHPALSRLVVNLQPELPDALQIDFSRPQFQPAAWLQLPLIRMSHDSSDSGVASRQNAASGLGPFRLVRENRSNTAFTANQSFITEGRPLIKQIVERKIRAPSEQLDALAKRTVDVVAYVPFRLIEKAQALSGVRVLKSSRPRVNLLQFNYSKPVLQQRTFRRALAYAIDRNSILEQLEVPIGTENRLISGPLPVGGFGYNESVKVRDFNLVLAKALVLGLKKKLGNIPDLTLAYEGNETVHAACRLIADNLRQAGLIVRLMEVTANSKLTALQADLHFRSLVIQEPIYDLSTLLTQDNPTLVDYASPWLRQLLNQLQEVPHYKGAQALLPSLHQVLHDDVALLPLWQWHEHFAVADNVGGVPELPAVFYDHVADWTVKPSFPDAVWQSANVSPLSGGGGQ